MGSESWVAPEDLPSVGGHELRRLSILVVGLQEWLMALFIYIQSLKGNFTCVDTASIPGFTYLGFNGVEGRTGATIGSRKTIFDRVKCFDGCRSTRD